MNKLIRRFEKIGAQVKEGYLDGSFEAVMNNKFVLFDEFGCWTESGFDDVNQETTRRNFSTQKAAINWILN